MLRLQQQGRSCVDHVIGVTGTIFIVISVGYLAIKSRIFKEDVLEPLGQFVVLIALPALVFRAISTQDIRTIADVGYLGGYLIGSLTILFLGYAVAGRFRPTSPVQRTFDAAGMTCANSGFVGYPLLLLATPAVAPTALALNMIVENLIIIPLVIVLAEIFSGRARGAEIALTVAKRLMSNPIVLAMLMGLGVVLLELKVPAPVERTIDILASSSIAISLFVIGGTVAGVSLNRIGLRVSMITFGKLIAMPLAVWFGFMIMEWTGSGVEDPELRKAAILMAATPAMTIYPLLAQRYGQAETAATAMLVMTTLSFFTLSAFIYVL